MSNKIKVTKEQAEAIEKFTKSGHTLQDYIEVSPSWTNSLVPLRELTIDEMGEIVYGDGYEIVKPKNKLFIISGHSGSGKSSIMKSVMHNEVISFTTREIRESAGEKEGLDYLFINKDEFHQLLNSKPSQLVEHVTYDGYQYGITKKEVDSKLEKNHAFVIVDVVGMRQLKKYYPNCVTIMLHSEYDETAKRLEDRGSSKGTIATRMSTYQSEVDNKIEYDYVVQNKNGRFSQTKKIISTIVIQEVSEDENWN